MKKLCTYLLLVSLILGCFVGCGGETAVDSTTSADETVSVATEQTSEAKQVSEVEQEESGAVEDSAVAETVAYGDPMEAMAQEYISYPLDGDNTISIWYYYPTAEYWGDTHHNYNAMKPAEAATGVTLDFTEVSSSSASELFSLMVSGGDMCDLIPAAQYYTNGLSKAYEDDVIIAIDEYIDEHMPNYAAVLDCLDDDIVEETLIEDRTLAFFTIADGAQNSNGLVTRADWLDELNWSFSGDIITLDELTDLMTQIYNQYKPAYTMYNYTGAYELEAAFDTEIPVLNPDGFMSYVTSSIFMYDDTVASGWVTDGYREYIEWVCSMTEQGILYADFVSLSSDRGEINTLTGAGDIALWSASADKMEEISGYTDDPDFAVTAVPRVVKDVDATYKWLDSISLVDTSTGFSISSCCENPELVCEFENYFWTTEGYKLANYGIENESYHEEADGSIIFDWQNPDTFTGKKAPNAESAWNSFTMRTWVGHYIDSDNLVSTYSETALAAVNLWNLEDADDSRNYPETLENGFTVEENEEIALYEGDFLTYATEACLKFMTGAVELNDDTWNEYISKCEAMGINDIIAVYQNAYDEYLAGER